MCMIEINIALELSAHLNTHRTSRKAEIYAAASYRGNTVNKFLQQLVHGA